MDLPQLADVADALAALDHASRLVVAAETLQVLAIAAACDLHRVDEEVLFAGAERWVRGGSDGTPDIGEFIAAEIGVLLGVSPASAMVRIANVLNVRHRHPALWAAVCAGEIRFHQAAAVAEACVGAGLDATACALVDRQCEIALRLQPWSRVRGQVDRWILLADPAQAAVREQRAAGARTLKVSGIQDGHCEVWGRVDAADGIAFDQALATIAQTLPTEIEMDARRAAAVGVLARQSLGQAELPTTAEIVVRIDATATAAGEVRLAEAAEVQGWGALLTDRLTGLLAGCRVTVRPVLDAQRLTPTDAYRMPPALRRVLHERWGVDAFPYGTRPARHCQSDHSTPFDHHAAPGHGQTHPDVMAPLSSFAHRAVTHGGFRREQPAPGHLLWTTPHGWRLLTTPAGTVLIHRPPPPQHSWWRQEPPDWLDEGDPPGPDPGEAHPPLALLPLLTC